MDTIRQFKAAVAERDRLYQRAVDLKVDAVISGHPDASKAECRRLMREGDRQQKLVKKLAPALFAEMILAAVRRPATGTQEPHHG